MLIGMDNPLLHIQREMIYRTDKHPIAVRYDLGWSCFGRPVDRSTALFPNLLLNKKEEQIYIKDILELLRTTWTYDQFPTDSLTLDEEHSVKTLTDTYKVIGQRAFVSPLFKPGYWENRPNQYLVEAHDWRPLHNTQMYAMSRLLILLCPLSMLLDTSIKGFPLSSRNHLHRNSNVSVPPADELERRILQQKHEKVHHCHDG
jgi:hypothetical protein